MTIFKKYCASLLVVIGLLVWWSGFGYFEDRFYCILEESSITVSLQEWETYCFSYIQKITNKIDTLNNDIIVAQEYIAAQEDVAYWKSIWAWLIATKNQYNDSRTQIMIAMQDYEKELFLRVKSLVSSYLKPEYDDITQKIQQADKLLEHLRTTWNKDTYQSVLQKRDALYREWLLLDAIKWSYSFETLLFPLKTYLDTHPEI